MSVLVSNVDNADNIILEVSTKFREGFLNFEKCINRLSSFKVLNIRHFQQGECHSRGLLKKSQILRHSFYFGLGLCKLQGCYKSGVELKKISWRFIRMHNMKTYTLIMQNLTNKAIESFQDEDIGIWIVSQPPCKCFQIRSANIQEHITLWLCYL